MILALNGLPSILIPIYHASCHQLQWETMVELNRLVRRMKFLMSVEREAKTSASDMTCFLSVESFVCRAFIAAVAMIFAIGHS